MGVWGRCSSALEWPAFSILRRSGPPALQVGQSTASPRSPALWRLFASGSVESAASYPRSWPEPCPSCPSGSLRRPSSKAPHPFANHSVLPVAGICPRPGRSVLRPDPRVRRCTVLSAVRPSNGPARELHVPDRAFRLLSLYLLSHFRHFPALSPGPLVSPEETPGLVCAYP